MPPAAAPALAACRALAAGVAGAAARAARRDEARLLAALQKAHPGTQFTAVHALAGGRPLRGLDERQRRLRVGAATRATSSSAACSTPQTMTRPDRPEARAAPQRKRRASAEKPAAGSASRSPSTSCRSPMRSRPCAATASAQLVRLQRPGLPYCRRLEPELAEPATTSRSTPSCVPFQGRRCRSRRSGARRTASRPGSA